jgi:hypothetical protein
MCPPVSLSERSDSLRSAAASGFGAKTGVCLEEGVCADVVFQPAASTRTQSIKLNSRLEAGVACRLIALQF